MALGTASEMPPATAIEFEITSTMGIMLATEASALSLSEPAIFDRQADVLAQVAELAERGLDGLTDVVEVHAGLVDEPIDEDDEVLDAHDGVEHPADHVGDAVHAAARLFADGERLLVAVVEQLVDALADVPRDRGDALAMLPTVSSASTVSGFFFGW